jgi:hypothetical protein
MDEAAVYQHRAEQCLALALGAQEKPQREQSIEMAMYWFRLMETINGGNAPKALPVRLDRQQHPARSGQANPAPLRMLGNATPSGA